jgi:Ca-activated chloride channel homolog
MISIQESHRFRRTVALVSVVAFVLASTASALPACSDQADAQAVEPAPTAGRTVMLVLDLSASMKQPINGEPDAPSRLDEAKRAIADVITTLPDDAVVGIRVYGNQNDAASPEARSDACVNDTQLVVAPAPLDRNALTAVVSGLVARGDTPIGAAMQAAVGDIPVGNPGTLILVTDGRDECYDADLDGNPAVGPSFGPAPCDVAAAIKEQRAELQVKVIGFDTTNFDLQSLACFGDTVQADDAASLSDELVGLATGTRRSVERLGGTRVDGTVDLTGAPPVKGELGATSRYTDELTPANSDQRDGITSSTAHYRVRLIRSASFTATATVFGLPTGDDNSLSLTLIGADGQRTLLQSVKDKAGADGSGVDSVRLYGWVYEQAPQRIDATLRLEVRSTSLADAVPVELPVELAIDGAAVTGGPPNCPPDTACQYTEIVPVLETYLNDVRAAADGTPPPANVEDPLASEVAALERQVSELGEPPASPARRSPVGAALAASLFGLALGAAVAIKRRRVISLANGATS